MLALPMLAVSHAQTPASAPAEEVTEDVMLHAQVITEDRETNSFVAEGEVEVRVGDRFLRADRVVYDRANKTFRAQGNVQIHDATGAVQFAEEIELDDGFRNGFATRFSTRMGGNAVATASAAIREDGTRNTLEQAIYTGCPLCEEGEGTPTWSLRARSAVQDQDSQMISYRDAVFEIKGVPVVYIPYFAHPDPTSERRSGLLIPDLGVSSKRGAFYEQPYLWTLSPSSELVLTPMINANVNPLVKVDYKKKFFSGYVDLESSFAYDQDFDSDGEKFGDETLRSHLYGRGRFNINEDWAWGFGIERQTDDLYDQRYDIDGANELRGLYTSQPRQLLSQLYTTGQQEDFYLEAGLISIQGLRATDIEGQIPQVAPTLFAEKVYDFKKRGQLATQLSAVGLFRDEAQTLPNGEITMDSARVTASADWGAQYVFGPGLVFEPFGLVRGDYYRLDDGSGVETSDVTRSLGLAGGTVSWPLVRHSENVSLAIEPIAMVAYGTEGANDGDIPNEDSLLFEADESNIFRPNALSNYDLWEGGARAAVGLTAKADFNQSFSFAGAFGRRWRAEDDPAFNNLSNLAENTSDYVAAVSAQVGQNFSTGARVRFDDQFEFARVDANMQTNIWRLRADARYFRIADNVSGNEDEGLMWSGQLRVTDRWSAVFRQQKNLVENRDVSVAAGIAYRDDCSYFALLYERSGLRDRTLGPSDSIQFEFVLTGLGGAANSTFD